MRHRAFALFLLVLILPCTAVVTIGLLAIGAWYAVRFAATVATGRPCGAQRDAWATWRRRRELKPHGVAAVDNGWMEMRDIVAGLGDRHILFRFMDGSVGVDALDEVEKEFVSFAARLAFCEHLVREKERVEQ